MRSLTLATAFSALAGFVLMWVAGWALDTGSAYRYFTAFWGLFFASAGLIDGITPVSYTHLTLPTICSV